MRLAIASGRLQGPVASTRGRDRRARHGSVTAHGGGIEVQSDTGHGPVFTIERPRLGGAATVKNLWGTGT